MLHLEVQQCLQFSAADVLAEDDQTPCSAVFLWSFLLQLDVVSALLLVTTAETSSTPVSGVPNVT